MVVTGAARMIEFLLVAGSASRSISSMSSARARSAHFIYLSVVLIAAAANTLLLQTFKLYSVPALQRVRQELRAHRARLDVGHRRPDGACLLREARRRFLAGVDRDLVRVDAAGAVRRAARSSRSSSRRWIREGRLNRRAVIVGGGTEAEELIKALEASHDTDIRIAGIFDDRGDGPRVAGRRRLSEARQYRSSWSSSRAARARSADRLAAGRRRRSGCSSCLKKLWVLPVDIRLSAHNNPLRFRPHTYSYIGNVPFIDVTDKPIADWDHVAEVAVRQDHRGARA